MPGNKSPGFDGLTYEFYRKQRDRLSPILVELFNFQLEKLKMIPPNKIGATRLISKVPPTVSPTLEELRPITLLNSDYQILSKVLTKQMVKVLPLIIKSPQSSCVPGRNILSSGCNLISSIEFAEKENIPSAILSLDLFKGYNRVNLIYLTKVLQAM